MNEVEVCIVPKICTGQHCAALLQPHPQQVLVGFGEEARAPCNEVLLHCMHQSCCNEHSWKAVEEQEGTRHKAEGTSTNLERLADLVPIQNVIHIRQPVHVHTNYESKNPQDESKICCCVRLMVDQQNLVAHSSLWDCQYFTSTCCILLDQLSEMFLLWQSQWAKKIGCRTVFCTHCWCDDDDDDDR